MADRRGVSSDRPLGGIPWLVIVIVCGVAVQGCASHVGSLVERTIQEAGPIVTGVQSDTEKIGKASMAFYDELSRWPLQYAELERFGRDHALDLQLVWIKGVELVPLDDGGLGIEFNSIHLPFELRNASASMMPVYIQSSSGKPLIVIHTGSTSGDPQDEPDGEQVAQSDSHLSEFSGDHPEHEPASEPK